MIEISSTCTLGKGLSVKREKAGDDGERVIAHLKFAEMFVDRTLIDDLCRRPIGWAQSCLFDDQGAPVAAIELGLPAKEWQTQGSIAGPGGEPRLALVGATLTGVVIALTPLGALVSGQLSWEARGDEVEDVTDLLGKEVKVDLNLNDGGQADLFRAAKTFTDIVAESGGGALVFPDGKKIEIPAADGPRISSAAEVMKKLKKGYELCGSDPDYWIEHPGSLGRQGVWLNAARSVLKRGLEPIGEQTDEIGRWRWPDAA